MAAPIARPVAAAPSRSGSGSATVVGVGSGVGDPDPPPPPQATGRPNAEEEGTPAHGGLCPLGAEAGRQGHLQKLEVPRAVAQGVGEAGGDDEGVARRHEMAALTLTGQGGRAGEDEGEQEARRRARLGEPGPSPSVGRLEPTRAPPVAAAIPRSRASNPVGRPGLQEAAAASWRTNLCPPKSRSALRTGVGSSISRSARVSCSAGQQISMTSSPGELSSTRWRIPGAEARSRPPAARTARPGPRTPRSPSPGSSRSSGSGSGGSGRSRAPARPPGCGCARR